MELSVLSRAVFSLLLGLCCVVPGIQFPLPSPSACNICFAFSIYPLGPGFKVTSSQKPYPCMFPIWHFSQWIVLLDWFIAHPCPTDHNLRRQGPCVDWLPVRIPSTWCLALTRCLWSQRQGREQVPPRELWHPAHLIYESVGIYIALKVERSILHCGYCTVPQDSGFLKPPPSLRMIKLPRVLSLPSSQQDPLWTGKQLILLQCTKCT